MSRTVNVTRVIARDRRIAALEIARADRRLAPGERDELRRLESARDAFWMRLPARIARTEEYVRQIRTYAIVAGVLAAPGDAEQAA